MSDTNKTISLGKFKAWLEGVEEMQDEGWTPSEIQWKKIRDKIELIEELKDSESPWDNASYPTIPQPQAPFIPPHRTFLDEKEFFDTHGTFSEEESRLTRPSGKYVPEYSPPPNGPVGSFEEGSVMPVKTPNTDSTNGYKSPYSQ